MAKRPQFSLTGIFLALTAIGVVCACLRSETSRIYGLPIAVSFFSGLLFPCGVRIGLALAAVVVVVNAALAEKDPSGLGPNEIVIPLHLAVFALPVFIAAWIGSFLRAEANR